ncbi:MAG: hypothetical protein WCI47_00285 [bacterium]
MNTKHSPNKSHALLSKIASHSVSTEHQILTDRGLIELFSWGSDRSPRARIKDTLSILTKQGDISLGTIENERLYKITSLGKSKLHLTQARDLARVTPVQWNQRWHFVTYQIPESKKVARNQLLIELKRIGFRRYSPALWIYPYDVAKYVAQIAEHYKVAHSIDYLRADTISQPARWRKHFGLK